MVHHGAARSMTDILYDLFSYIYTQGKRIELAVKSISYNMYVYVMQMFRYIDAQLEVRQEYTDFLVLHSAWHIVS